MPGFLGDCKVDIDVLQSLAALASWKLDNERLQAHFNSHLLMYTSTRARSFPDTTVGQYSCQI